MNLYKNRPLAQVCTCLIAGCLLAVFLIRYVQMPEGLWPILSASLLLTTALFSFFGKKKRLLLFFCALALVSGCCVTFLWDSVSFRPFRTAEKAPHVVSGKVESISPENGENELLLHVCRLDGQEVSLRAVIDLPEEEEVCLHDTVRCVARLAPADAYRQSDGIAGNASLSLLLCIEHPDSLCVTEKIQDSLSALRTLFSQRLGKAMGREEAGLLRALLLADKSGITGEETLSFRRSGLSHTLALSGLHLSVLSSMLLFFFRAVRSPRWLSAFFLFLFVSLYGALSGFVPSLVRATLMLLITQAGFFVRRDAEPITSLFVAVSLLFLLSPGAIYDIGLWLSFTATLGLLVGSELFRRVAHGFFRRFFSGVLTGLLLTLFAMLFTTGITAFLFGEISLISPLANLAVSPLLSLLLALGIVTLIFPGCGALCSPVASLLLRIVRAFSSLPGILFPLSHPVIRFAVLLTTVGVVLFLVLPFRRKKAAGYHFLALALAFCVFSSGFHFMAQSGNAAFYRARSMGEYLFFRTDDGTVFFSASQDPFSVSSLVADMKSEGIGEIDLLILPEYRKNSAKYLQTFCTSIKIRKVLFPKPSSLKEWELYASVAAAAAKTRTDFGYLPAEETTIGSFSYLLRYVPSSPFTSAPAYLAGFRLKGKTILYVSGLDSLSWNEKRTDLLILGDCPSEKTYISPDREIEVGVLIAKAPDTPGLSGFRAGKILYSPPHFCLEP